MIHLIEHHGIECLIGYYFLIAILGTMPQPGPNASYLQRWCFAAAQTFCANVKTVAATIQKSANLSTDTGETK